jgi:hypothetical protein
MDSYTALEMLPTKGKMFGNSVVLKPYSVPFAALPQLWFGFVFE